jgi:hypothetical protein
MCASVVVVDVDVVVGLRALFFAPASHFSTKKRTLFARRKEVGCLGCGERRATEQS